MLGPRWHVNEILSGQGGWAGAGLLGLVLGWLLLKHLPAKDAQLSALLKDKDAQVLDMITAFSTMLEKQRTDFREVLTYLQEACEREMTAISNGFKRDMEYMNSNINSLNTYIAALLRKENGDPLKLIKDAKE